MDINALSSIVGTLILDRDELVLPRFGAFKAELVGATFSDKGYAVNPPYRQLHFTASDCWDNLLYKALAAQDGISVEDAAGEVDACIRELKKELATLGTAELPGLGKFRTTRDGDCIFIMDPDAGIYPDGWGLPGVSLKNRERQHSHATVTPELDLSEESHGIPAEDVVVELEPTSEPASEPAPEPTPVPKKKRSFIPGFLLTIVILALLAFVALRLLGIYAPDIVDSILYTPEELEQLHKSL